MKNNKGFSLVELIVVIAIMAILATVAVIGVSVYIPKAQKQADQTLVTELVNAIDMAATINPDEAPDGATLYLSLGNAYISGDADGKLAAILTDIYGSDYASDLKLKYDQWGLGGTITNYAGQLSQELGNNKLTYQEDVDSLWNEVENILIGLQDQDMMNSMYGGSAGLMGAASDYTVNNSKVTSKEEFAKMWANPGDYFNSYTEANYNPDATYDEDAMTSLLAKCAANKGRNFAFGNYIAGNPALGAIAGEFMAESSETGIDGYEDFDSMLSQLPGCDQATAAALVQAINTYFGSDCANSSQLPDGTYRVKVISVTPNTSSPAYYDGLGYFTLMQAVDDSSSDTANMSNEEYLNTMAGAVHNVGAMLNDSNILNNVSDGCVSINIRKNADGTLAFYITPSNIYAGSKNVQSGVGNSTVVLNNTVTVVIDCREDGSPSIGTADGTLVLKKGTTGTIILVPSENLKAALSDADMEADDYFAQYVPMTSNSESVATIANGTVSALNVGSAEISCSTLFSVIVTVVEN